MSSYLGSTANTAQNKIKNKQPQRWKRNETFIYKIIRVLLPYTYKTVTEFLYSISADIIIVHPSMLNKI